MDTNILRPTERDVLDAWASLVAADAGQVARVREPEPPKDHYQAQAHRFRPGVMEAPEVALVEHLARPGDILLDIGAGGGRFAVPLSGKVAKVIAVEPSESMRSTLGFAAEATGRTNIEVRATRWPEPSWADAVDLSLAAHVVYDITEIGPFLDAMERYTRRLCVAVLYQFARGWNFASLFEAVHGEPVHLLPAFKEFVALLNARNRCYEVTTVDRPASEAPMPRDDAFETARRMLWLAPGSEKETRMRELMEQWWGTPAGIQAPPAPGETFVAVVSWTPPRP